MDLQRFRGLFAPGKAGFSQDSGLLVARVGFAGTLMWRHGIPKIPLLGAEEIQFMDPLGLGPALSLALAAFAECICAVMLMVGVLSRVAAGILTLNFAVIVFVLHGSQVPGDRGELALLYLVAFSALFLIGPGPYSIDARVNDPKG